MSLSAGPTFYENCKLNYTIVSRGGARFIASYLRRLRIENREVMDSGSAEGGRNDNASQGSLCFYYCASRTA